MSRGQRPGYASSSSRGPDRGRIRHGGRDMPSGLDSDPRSGNVDPQTEESTPQSSHSTVSGPRPHILPRALHRRLVDLSGRTASESAAKGAGHPEPKARRAPAWREVLSAAIAVGVASGL